MFDPFTIAANTEHVASVSPTNATTTSLFEMEVNAAKHLDAYSMGQAWYKVSRTDAGAWVTTATTKRPHIGLIIDQLDDGVGGGLARIIGG